MHYRMDVYKITEMRDGCVFKTKKVNSIWLDVKPRERSEETLIAQKHGGDSLASTLDYCFDYKCSKHTLVD